MKRIYIAGPMTGYTDHNYPEFNRVADILAQQGWSVLNPAHNFNGRSDMPYDWYIREDLKLMSFADALVLLSGWKSSRGSLLELHAAWLLGMDIYEWNIYDELQTIIHSPHELLIHQLVAHKFWMTADKLLGDDDEDCD